MFAAVNDLQRTVGTYLSWRRMYEMMVYWETAGDDSAVEREFTRLWRVADKIVYSRTLETPSSARARIERTFDPEAIRALKASATRDLTIAGADLAVAGLVDEYHLFLLPVLIGGGHRALPDGVGLPLGLLDERRFAGGVVRLRYRVTA
ncbi:dihydrofolate reductase family protein [Amycolatopsis sp. FDAARGOS 1241]|uniref:dihydrofolate reductase family protein n=1 Tax=Amycolatopsis sp. FDAARGOS 1241 TaxID=2778070 RepID=UPI001EF1F387|nr:dihydrofolate reductase family protein [Amycolatopsis sp. FDAARGOS 1241]